MSEDSATIESAVTEPLIRLGDGEVCGVPDEPDFLQLPDEICGLRPPAPLLAQDVMGADNRVREGRTNTYPWRAICHLVIRHRDGTLEEGTGWFIGQRTVFTAAHNIFSHKRGAFAKEILVVPGRNGQTAPVGFQTTDRWVVHPSFRGSSANALTFDYGALFLPDGSMGHRTGRFLFHAMSSADLNALSGNLSGYPNEFRQPQPSEFGSQWRGFGRIATKGKFGLSYAIDTTEGQSGSPLFVGDTDGNAVALGLHVHGTPTGNSARRITRKVVDDMKAWMNVQ